MASAVITEMSKATPDFVGLPVSDGVRIFALVVGWLYCVTGVFGNILIIVTLLTQRSLKSLHNLYVGNLAVADLIVVGYCIPFWLLDLALGYCPVVNAIHCHVNSFLLHFAINSSVFSLVVIGFNRYLSVCHPHLYGNLFTRNKTVAYCVGMWLLSAAQGTLPFFKLGHTSYHYSVSTRLCTYAGSVAGNVFSVLEAIEIIGATILVGFFNFSIFRFWKKSRNRIDQWSRDSNPRQAPLPRISENRTKGRESPISEGEQVNKQLQTSETYLNKVTESIATVSLSMAVQGCSHERTAKTYPAQSYPLATCIARGTERPSCCLQLNSKKCEERHALSLHFLTKTEPAKRPNDHKNNGQFYVDEKQRIEHTGTDTKVYEKPRILHRAVGYDRDHAKSSEALPVVQGQTYIKGTTSSEESFRALHRSSNEDEGHTLPKSETREKVIGGTSLHIQRDIASSQDSNTSDRSKQTSQSKRSKTAEEGRAGRPRLSASDLSLLRSLALVFVLLVLLYIPVIVAAALFGYVHVPPEVFCLCLLCFFLNQSINWIVYGALNKNFKNGYKRLLLSSCTGNVRTIKRNRCKADMTRHHTSRC